MLRALYEEAQNVCRLSPLHSFTVPSQVESLGTVQGFCTGDICG